MENRIYDETNCLWYERHGDYYFPQLGISAEQATDDRPIFKYADMRLRYEKLLTMFNDIMQGRTEYLGVFVGGTPQSRMSGAACSATKR